MAPSRRALLFVALLVGIAGCSERSASSSDGTNVAAPGTSIRIPLREYFRGLRSVSVSIGDRAYVFLLDSGGGRTLMSPELAKTLGCEPRGRDVGYRMNGEVVAFQQCPRLDADASGFGVHLAPAGVFDVNALLPAELPRVDGVIALDAFRGQVVSIDWSHGAIVVHSPADAATALRDHGIPIRLATGENGANLEVLVRVAGVADGLWFLVDSGDIRGTLISRHLEREGAFRFASESVAELRIGGGEVEALRVTADDINFDGVFGTDFLMTRIVTLDLRRVP
jgi:hypothetical protein